MFDECNELMYGQMVDVWTDRWRSERIRGTPFFFSTSYFSKRLLTVGRIDEVDHFSLSLILALKGIPVKAINACTYLNCNQPSTVPAMESTPSLIDVDL
jgi:hypothetical protein